MKIHHTVRSISFRVLGLRLLGLAVVGLAVVGCGGDSEEQRAAELLQSQRRRQQAQEAAPKSADQRIDEARGYYDRQNYSAAQDRLRPLLVADDADADALLLYAKCEAEIGDPLAACEVLRSIPPSAPVAFADAGLLAADLHLQLGDYDRAEASLMRIVDLAETVDVPRINAVYHRLASLLNNQGRRIEAAEYLRRLLRAEDITEKELFAMNTLGDAFIDVSMPKPNFGGALPPAALAEAKRLRGEGELEQAKRLIERLSEAYPKSTPIAAFRCRVYAEMKLDPLLDDYLDSVPDGIEREPEYWYAVGMRMQSSDRDDQAVRCFLEAVTLDPTDRFSYLGLARSLKSLGKDAEADCANQRFSLLHESSVIMAKIGGQPGTAAELSRLAEILDALHRPWEALAWRQVALKTHGGSPESRQRLLQRREQIADGETDATATSGLRCGLELDQWPLPSTNEFASGTPAEPRADLETASSTTEIRLNDVAADLGMIFHYDGGDDPSDEVQLLHQLTGGGIAVIDYDLDGYPDVYFTQGGGDAFDADGSKPNALFRNRPSAEWISVSAEAGTGDLGYGQGVAVADINQDGFPDMILANIGPNVVYQNNGDGTFRRRLMAAVAPKGDWTSSIACGDLSGDHLPEIVEINYIDDPTALSIGCTPDRDACNPSVFRPAVDRAWQVRSDGTVTRWDGCQSMDELPNYGFGGVIANFDDAHGNDLFIANDTEFNHFWLSGRDSQSGPVTLRESAQIAGCAFGLLGQRQGCMGIAAGDFDRNGRVDLHVTNFWNQAADLYSQESPGVFTNVNAKRGLYEDTRMTVGWGTQAVDFDRNGWLDLPVLNGNLTDHRHRGRAYQMLPQFFRGNAGGFELQNPADPYWETPALGRTMAVLDFNRDLKPDLVTNHLDAPAALLENRTATENALQLELIGTTSERDAIGAKVSIAIGDESWVGWVFGGDGLLCTNEQVLDFGLGRYDAIDRIDVSWPSGANQSFSNIKANQRYLVVEGEADLFQR
ncbi:FG-GAP-like repeat-containing protein [Rhodopirellula sp. JC639]|uniref:FG-GAP-like repeat-containing protein n=1 Tax=Stieleria mannarensis TaxID=2755585 RepID=UPI00160349FF|nr:FG-GAP-like repeat-containing protein [Rhodopirellula sp. JC639]